MCSLGMVGLAATAAPQTQETPPTWELGKNAIDPATTKGASAWENGMVKLDGANSFTVPATVLGSQDDYTIELEFKRAASFTNLPRMEGALRLLSNRDSGAHAGLSLVYFPPGWDSNGGVSNRFGMDVNGYWNGECDGLEGDGFNTYTVVVKNRMAALYRNGLLLAMTGEIKPSELPLTVGGPGWRGATMPKEGKPVPAPYELRSLKVYDRARLPTGYDRSAEVMRNCAGDGYSMQRADITDPTLPRILVVGDSISMGYRGFITQQFKGRAYVDYWVGGSWFALTVKDNEFPALHAWDGVFANGPYDVVSWNAMTLHMWNGAPGRCPEATYPAHMTRVVEHLQTTAPGTRFIWVRCTPWRTTPTDGRPALDPAKNDAICRLNSVTDGIMAKHGIPEVDLYSLCVNKLDTVPAGSQDAVHWNQEVSREMAGEISKEIEKALPPKHRENISGQTKTSLAPAKLRVMQCWDDSLTTDIPLVKLLQKYQAKATFNIIPMKERRGFVVKQLKPEKGTPFSFMPRETLEGFKVEHLNNEEMKEIYKGFKVAAHCGFSNDETPEAVEPRRRVLLDTMALIKENFHQDKVGFVYPGGGYNKTVMQAVQDAGYLYGRTTQSADAPLPLDTPMALPTSCHWNSSQFWDRYEAAKEKGGLFYFWGHSCELGDDPYLWENLATIYARIAADPDAEWIDVIDLFEPSAVPAAKAVNSNR